MSDREPTLVLTAEELAGDLPRVCARTGSAEASLTSVWFMRSPRWAWTPLLLLLGLAAAGRSWAPLASWWAVGAVLAPVLLSRGAVGRVPLSTDVRRRLASLRRRRLGLMLTALLLTWVAVTLWLVGSRAGGLLMLALVVGMYTGAGGMFVAGRLLSVGGRPEDDGGATLTRVHPGFVAAVELRRTGHRP